MDLRNLNGVSFTYIQIGEQKLEPRTENFSATLNLVRIWFNSNSLSFVPFVRFWCYWNSVLVCGWIFVRIQNLFLCFVLLLNWIRIWMGNGGCITGFWYEHSWSVHDVHMEIWENEWGLIQNWMREKEILCLLTDWDCRFWLLWLFSL